jgi:hypothetical protein
MSFVELHPSRSRVRIGTCRHCGLEIWQSIGDDVWLCDASPGLYCPDTGRGTPPLHAPVPVPAARSSFPPWPAGLPGSG